MRGTRIELLVAVAGLIAACGPKQSNPIDASTPRDLSTAAADLAGIDLQPPVDLAIPPDFAPQRPWIQHASGTSEDLLGVWSDGSKVFAVGSNGTVQRYTTATGWMKDASAPVTTESFLAVSGNGGGVAYAAGTTGTIWKFESNSWGSQPSTTSNLLRALWTHSTGVSYAVGDAGTLLYGPGAGIPPWTARNGAGVADVYGVWGSSATDVYAVGAGGMILRTNGGASNFGAYTSPTTEALLGVWGSSAADIYAVGANGTILRKSTVNGAFAKLASGTTETLEAVAGSGPGEVYVVGPAGLVMRSFDHGATWLKETVGTQDLKGVWVSATDVYVVGKAGAIWHR